MHRFALVAVVASLVVACGDPDTGSRDGAEPIADRSESHAPPPTDRAPGHDRMRDLLRQLAVRAIDGEHPYAGSATLRRLRAEVDRRGSRADWRLLLDTASELLRHGEERAAIGLLQRAHAGLATGALEGDDAARIGIAYHLGTAWLRLAETENCCADPNRERCIVPIVGDGTHDRPEGAENAARCFAEVLDRTAPDDYWHYAARWLLNITQMTLGSWPDAVPVAHRLPASAFRDDSGLPRFVSVAAELGLDTNGTAGSVVVEDFDGDERLDVMVSSWGPSGHLRCFRHLPDGSFVDRTDAAGLAGFVGGLNMVAADYDDDGFVDVLVLRGAWSYEHGAWPCSLLRNRGDGTFEDVTFAAGLGDRRDPTQTAAWADYDVDGDLDLYIGSESSERRRSRGHLYENDGAGHFTDVTIRAGVANERYCKGAVFGDIDGDGYPDLFLSNLGQPNRLYQNLGDGTFRDIAEAAGVTEPINSFPTWFWDFDNDGHLDLFVADYHVGIAHLCSHVTGGALPFEHARLFLGDGAGAFRDASASAGLARPMMPMGANYGDLDNDGWLDCYLGTGDPQFSSLMPNVMLRNVRGERLDDVTMSTGFGHLQKGHGVAFADFDHDGDQDVFAVLGGAYPGDAFRDALFENPGSAAPGEGHWLTVRLVGTESARSAIGARIHVVVRDDGRQRDIYRNVDTGGSFGSAPLRQTVGLGGADEIVHLEVRWPRVGPGGAPVVERFSDVPMDQGVRIVEGSGKVERLHLHRMSLHGD